MSNPVLKKLECFGPLPKEDKALVESVLVQERDVPTKVDLIREGDDPVVVHLVTSGFACRYKRLTDGRRQIVAFLLPGDFADPYTFMLETMDHSISTLAPSKIVKVSKASILGMLERPALASALFKAALTDSATLREWIATMGQRNAENRIAHLFCEIHTRLRAVDLISDGVGWFPITQSELSDAVGISNVHTNRSLRSLRQKGLIRFSSGNLEILDAPRLADLCGFTPNYLHLQPNP